MANQHPRFNGAKLKFFRAGRHLQELKLEMADFYHTGFGKIVTEHDQNSGSYVLRFIQTRSLSPAVPLMIGDVVHSLRASLDLLASEIAREVTHDVNRIHFPFHEHLSNLTAQAAKKEGFFKYIGPKMMRIVINDIKPYKAGNYKLWALNKLDQIDKHRLIIANLELRHVGKLDAVWDNGKKSTIKNLTIGGRGDVTLLSDPKPFKLDGKPNLAFDLVFDERQYLFGEPVLQTLSAITHDVAGIIDAFQAISADSPASA